MPIMLSRTDNGANFMRLLNSTLQNPDFSLPFVYDKLTGEKKMAQKASYARKPQGDVYVFSITKLMQRRIQWLCIIGLLLTVGFVMTSFHGSYHDFFNMNVLMPAVFSIIGIFFAWKFINNELRFKLHIREPPQPKQLSLPTRHQPAARYAFFNSIASICAVVFVLLIWVQLYVASSNPIGHVNVFYNAFNEMGIETVILLIFGCIILINTAISIMRQRVSRSENI